MRPSAGTTFFVGLFLGLLGAVWRFPDPTRDEEERRALAHEAQLKMIADHLGAWRS